MALIECVCVWRGGGGSLRLSLKTTTVCLCEAVQQDHFDTGGTTSQLTMETMMVMVPAHIGGTIV